MSWLYKDVEAEDEGLGVSWMIGVLQHGAVEAAVGDGDDAAFEVGGAIFHTRARLSRKSRMSCSISAKPLPLAGRG